MDDGDQDRAVVLPYLVGRLPVAHSVYEAFGDRKALYDNAVREARFD
jgi:hypothetical protein